MLKLSTKGRYGARLMLSIAMYGREKPVSLKEISDREDISVGYLEHLVPPLKAAGLIKSIRGKNGGYTLARSLSDISLSEIIELLEDAEPSVKCIKDPSICVNADCCVSRDIWQSIESMIEDRLMNISLEEMVENHRMKQNEKDKRQ